MALLLSGWFGVASTLAATQANDAPMAEVAAEFTLSGVDAMRAPRPDEATVAVARIEISGTQDVAARLLEAVYRRAGIPLRIQAFPAPRANAMSRRGEVDGELARIGRYYEENPHLIRVEPPLMWTDATVFMLAERARPVARAADLAGLRVGVVRGVRQSLEAVEGVAGVELVTDPRQLYRMLARGRLDVVVDSTVSMRRFTAELGLVGVVESGVLSRRAVYHGLQRRHAGLAGPISEALIALRASGELDALERAAADAAARPGGSATSP